MGNREEFKSTRIVMVSLEIFTRMHNLFILDDPENKKQNPIEVNIYSDGRKLKRTN